MRVPNAVHEAHPWVVGRIAPDFRLLDVWALPVEGGPDDFGRVVEVVVGSFDPNDAGLVTRALFAVRTALGALLRWDDPGKRRTIPGTDDASLAARLPAELQGSATAPQPKVGEFVPLYRTDDEWAAELSNDTVHGVLHLAWAEQAAGRYRARLAVYVKPRGRLGRVYLAAIAPFRHAFVYPALVRHVGRAWAAANRA